MAAYTLYVSAALVALVSCMVDLRDHPRSFLLLFCSASMILLLALSGLNDLNTLISAAIVFCFAVFSCAIYILVNLIREIAAAFNYPSASGILHRTAILWLPLPVILVLMSFFSSAVHYWAAEKMYSIETSYWHCGEQHFLLCRDKYGSFEVSLHLTNAKFFDDANSAVRKRVERLRQLPRTTEPVFRKNVDEELFGKSPIVPVNLFDRMHGCNFFDWIGNIGYCIKSTILNRIHDAYEDFRIKLQSDLDDRITAEFQEAQTPANMVANAVYLNIDRKLQSTKESLDTNIDRAFFLRNTAHFLSLIAAVLVSLKILLYILVRLVFDEYNAKKGCALSTAPATHSQIVARRILSEQSGSNSQVISLQPDEEVLYVTLFSKGAQPSRYGTFCWPHKSECLLRRIIHNKLFFNKYGRSEYPISINSELNNAFCSIKLKAGDCLAFSMGSLFAFTEGITFHLAIRIRAAILLQRRFLFATATGPGTIVLVARGGAIAILPSGADYANIDDVIGFDLNGSVYTSAQPGFIDMYFRSFSIKPETDTLMVRKPPGPRWSMLRLLHRFAGLVLPF
jgi:hypothetical protein